MLKQSATPRTPTPQAGLRLITEASVPTTIFHSGSHISGIKKIDQRPEAGLPYPPGPQDSDPGRAVPQAHARRAEPSVVRQEFSLHPEIPMRAKAGIPLCTPMF